jgi:hypothetical protein
MKIVIDITDEMWQAVQDGWVGNDLWHSALKNGTPLPKGHGDLADKGDIIHDIDCDEEMRLGKNVEWVREVIRNAPTIIKASEEGAVG